jgi:hypothetical protein
MDLIRSRRRAVSTALALLLAVESVAVVSVAASSTLAARSATHALPAASPAGEVLAEVGSTDAASQADPAAASPMPAQPAGQAYRRPSSVALTSPAPSATPRPAAAKPSVKPAVKPRPAVKPKAAAKPRAASYSGRNHVWIPALGVSRSISFFSCTRSAPPDNYVYRWGCAGANNVYLLGHAYGVFKPLHDAYVSGRLRAGMRVYYADGSGTTRVYAVRWWKVVRPTTDASWAWAPQATPSMTLQTCVGADSAYRLIVRLGQVG